MFFKIPVLNVNTQKEIGDDRGNFMGMVKQRTGKVSRPGTLKKGDVLKNTFVWDIMTLEVLQLSKRETKLRLDFPIIKDLAFNVTNSEP